MTRNPKPRVLLTSVYRPFAKDCQESRLLTPLELFHCQLTRAQGPFSLRMNHHSAGPLFISHNINAHTTVLDFPTIGEFCSEIKSTSYDYVGISSIVPNITKAKRMAEAVRKYSPRSKIVIGGHVTSLEGIEKIIDADHFVRGEGIAWFRRELGENPDDPIYHPTIKSAFNVRIMGFPFNERSAWLVTGFGCPKRCNFCSTSHFFGGYKVLLKTGREIFDLCCRIEHELGVSTFFALDDNFLLNKSRIEALYELVKTSGKLWRFSVFASADAIGRYDLDFLVELGVHRIWIGLESKHHLYQKNAGSDLKALLKDLKQRGIITIGSSILGLPEHTYEKALEDINNSIDIAPDFQQFTLSTALPGTALWREKKEAGTLLANMPFEDAHGTYRLNWSHEHLTNSQSEELLKLAVSEDFRLLGPSIFRSLETRFLGVKHYEHHANPLIQKRRMNTRKNLQYVSPVLWAIEKYLQFSNPQMSKKICALRREIQAYFGIKAKLSLVLGPVCLAATFYEYVKRDILKVPHEPKTCRYDFN